MEKTRCFVNKIAGHNKTFCLGLCKEKDCFKCKKELKQEKKLEKGRSEKAMKHFSAMCHLREKRKKREIKLTEIPNES